MRERCGGADAAVEGLFHVGACRNAGSRQLRRSRRCCVEAEGGSIYGILDRLVEVAPFELHALEHGLRLLDVEGAAHAARGG